MSELSREYLFGVKSDKKIEQHIMQSYSKDSNSDIPNT